MRAGSAYRLLSLAAALLFLPASAASQTFFYYDANGHSQGKIICADDACEVFANSTSLGRVAADGTAFDAGGTRLSQTADYGRNWRPGNFSVRPELPPQDESSADPEGWRVPLEEALHSDAIGGDLDRLQLRALQAASIAFGAQHDFVSAADAKLQRRAGARDSFGDSNIVPALVVHDANQNAYIMLRGMWVLAIGKASNSNQATVWWPGSGRVDTAVAPLGSVVAALNAAGIVLSNDDSGRVQEVPLRAGSALSSAPAPAEPTLCVSGDPRLRGIVQDAIQAASHLTLECSDAGNDLVLSVNPTGRWIAVLQPDDPQPYHFRYPRTAFEAVGVLRTRAGRELWWVRKEAWNGRGDRARVAQQIARAFQKFYASYAPHSSASLARP
ncbi:MAG: hypothetical protein JO041_16160 [Acidobacteria bacterium]|nr:hypothetical protein [Acidobacteriota bacterium]